MWWKGYRPECAHMVGAQRYQALRSSEQRPRPNRRSAACRSTMEINTLNRFPRMIGSSLSALRRKASSSKRCGVPAYSGSGSRLKSKYHSLAQDSTSGKLPCVSKTCQRAGPWTPKVPRENAIVRKTSLFRTLLHICRRIVL